MNGIEEEKKMWQNESHKVQGTNVIGGGTTGEEKKMASFETGATRNPSDNKHDYEGFLSPLVLHRFGQFMHKNRYTRTGEFRDSDNWQLGIPIAAYRKSLVRHLIHLWLAWRGWEDVALDEDGKPQDVEDLLCAIIFNAQGMLHEMLKRQYRPIVPKGINLNVHDLKDRS